VVTTDFFTPVVDDPYDYGQIAAANSLSDIYAMGGQPFLALNIAALPTDLPPAIGRDILRGGAEKALEAGVVIAGGHTIRDQEPKYGLVVLGFVHPDQKMTKAGLHPGDRLVLTKPLGFGVTTTALKQEKAEACDVAEVVEWMKLLNKDASLLANEFKLQAGTDITGFSLMGHALEMANASRVNLELSFNDIPLVSCAEKYARMGAFPGGAMDNLKFFGSQVKYAIRLHKWQKLLLFDPQTNGGLLLAVPEKSIQKFIKKAQEINVPAWLVGRVKEGQGIDIV